MPLSVKAEPLLQLFREKALAIFANRAVSLFKFGSLGTRGDFSLCSDVDVVLMLDQVEEDDEIKVTALWEEIKNSGLMYADRLSLYWSSYCEGDFSKGKGRFPALDRLDLILNAILLAGTDRRKELQSPMHEEIVIESAKFILGFMLAGEKTNELAKQPTAIMKKGARYFTKFVLFPLRLIFTLDNPGLVGTNRDAVNHFLQGLSNNLPTQIKELVKSSYALRNHEPNQIVKLNTGLVKEGLLSVYAYCVKRYAEVLVNLGKADLAEQLFDAMRKVMLLREQTSK